MAIYRKDRDGRFTFGNQRFCDGLGETPPAIVGRTDFDFYPPELEEEYQRDDRRIVATGEVFEAVEAHHDPAQWRAMFRF